MKKYLIINTERNSYLTLDDTLTASEQDAWKFDSYDSAQNWIWDEGMGDEYEVVARDFIGEAPDEECKGALCQIENCPICKNEMY